MYLLKEISLFKQSLKDYKKLLGQIQLHQPIPDAYQNKRESLLLNSSSLILQIKKLTDKDESLVIYELGKPRSVNMWEMGLRNEYDYRTVEALDACIDNTTLAIGKLESDIQKGIRDEQGNKIGEPQVITEAPKAFIAHGGRSGVLNKLREFVEALGIKPIIVELSASKGMSVDDKVNKYIKDADCGIVLATKGGIVDTKGKEPKKHPRLNVIDELERLRAAFPEKTILLLERGVDLPSNISGLTYEPFVGQSMDRAFTAIARELTEFGILKAVKPQEQEHKP